MENWMQRPSDLMTEHQASLLHVSRFVLIHICSFLKNLGQLRSNFLNPYFLLPKKLGQLRSKFSNPYFILPKKLGQLTSIFLNPYFLLPKKLGQLRSKIINP